LQKNGPIQPTKDEELMNRRDFLGLTVAALTHGTYAADRRRPRPVEKPSAPPNIIIIICDNLGYGDLECLGSKTNYTPHN